MCPPPPVGVGLKLFVLSEAKDANVKLFNIKAKINEVKPLVRNISCDCKYKLIVQHVIHFKNRIMINVNVAVLAVLHQGHLRLKLPSTNLLVVQTFKGHLSFSVSCSFVLL